MCSSDLTRMGVSLADGHFQAAAEALGLIALFVAGAAGGSLIVLRRHRYRQSAVLLTEAGVLALAALGHGFGLDRFAVAAIVLAMGIENAVFQVDGGTGLGLTYITGALVKVGQLMATALAGGARLAWVPNLLLWAAMVAGALLGALAFHWINLAAIWLAAAAALVLGVLVGVAAKNSGQE